MNCTKVSALGDERGGEVTDFSQLNDTFLYAERVDGPVARVYDAVFCACGHDSMVDWEAGVFGDVQLPAELPDKRQAHRSHLDQGKETRSLEQQLVVILSCHLISVFMVTRVPNVLFSHLASLSAH